MDSMNNNVNSSLKPGAAEIVFKYLTYLPLFIIILGLSVSISWLYLRYKIPKYNSSLSLLIKDDSKAGGTSDAILEGLGVGKKRANLANETEILRTATLMKDVVDSLHLNLQYFSGGNVKKSELYGNRPFNFIPYNITDSTQGFTFALKFNNKGQFKLEGMPAQWHNPGETVAAYNQPFVLQVTNPQALNPQYTYFVVWHHSVRGQTVLAKRMSAPCERECLEW